MSLRLRNIPETGGLQLQKHSRNRSVAEPVIIQKQENWEHSRNEHYRTNNIPETSFPEPGTFQKQKSYRTRNITETREIKS